MHFDQFLSYFLGFMHLLQCPLLRIHKQNATYQFWAKVTSLYGMSSVAAQPPENVIQLSLIPRHIIFDRIS